MDIPSTKRLRLKTYLCTLAYINNYDYLMHIWSQGGDVTYSLQSLYHSPQHSKANISLSHHLYANDTKLFTFLKTFHLSLINFNPRSQLFPPG